MRFKKAVGKKLRFQPFKMRSMPFLRMSNIHLNLVVSYEKNEPF